MDGHRKRTEREAPVGEAATPLADAGAPAMAGPQELPEAEAEAAAAAPQGGALVEPTDQALVRLELELAEWKDRALRAAADLDNFRKRATREREEAFGRGQSDVVLRVLDVVDDLARVAGLDPATTSSQALHEGMLQIERKFMKVLESAGVERVDPLGQPFDPQFHEAVMTMPGSTPESDHTVGAVFQHGYRVKGILLRPAKVAVVTVTAPPAGEAEAAG